uniref:Cytochrome P450 monooxygenase CYP93B12 n=1 Tax=Medicago truncatula TaxID=3880 RepID=Q2MIZ2_MEDTR|nr:cytochrome P450 monooxygenase CYP93B12 [Medicago truncatula]
MISHSFSLAMILLLFLFIFQLLSYLKRNKKLHARLPPHPPSPPAIPIIGHLHLLKPLIHQAFRHLSDQYGPLISLRLGSSQFIIVNTPSLAKEFLKTHELTYSHRKMSIAINVVAYDDATFAFAPYGTYWKFIKKLSTTELLGNRTMAQFLPIRTQELHEFIQTLANKSKAEESVNLTQALIKLSNNIISRMMLSIDCSGTDNQAEQVRALVREVTQIFGEFNVSDFIGIFKNFDLQGFKKEGLGHTQKVDALLDKIISDREELRREAKLIDGGGENGEEERLKDFLDICLDVYSEKNCEVNFTRNHIKSLILDSLRQQPTLLPSPWNGQYQNCLTIQGCGKKHKRRWIKLLERKDLCVKKTVQTFLIYMLSQKKMRLHPPIPMIMRKGMEDCVVDGNMILKGSMVCVNIWAMARDPKIWENPLEFRPERFLENKDIDMKGHQFELLPFGSGRRGCPGMPLALRQLPTVIGALVQCFEWKMLDSECKILDQGKKN